MEIEMYGNTPMMAQYKKIKDEYQDCILFYRLGDFYEMFGPDATVASQILNIALTSREAGKGKRIPMCGVPHHSAENYISKLIEKGYKVAICEQVEDPKEAKGIVKREVIRVITPGTLLDGNLLKDTNNYLIAVVTDGQRYGLASVDISTGEYYATEIEDASTLINEVLRYNPAECIIAEGKDQVDILENLLNNINELYVNKHWDFAFRLDNSQDLLLEHFQIHSLHSLGCHDFPLATQAAGAILDYLISTQKTKPANLHKLKIYNVQDTMHLDFSTRRNLELTKSLHTNDKKASLLGCIDYTSTALGGRMLKQWLQQPLKNKVQIQERLDAVEEIIDYDLRRSIQQLLKEIYDLERIAARIAFQNANAKDLIALKNSLALLPDIKKILIERKTDYLQNLATNLDTLEDVYNILDNSLLLDPPFSLREGNLIKDNYNQEVDELRLITREGKQWIADLEQEEKEKTGIKSLKVGFNKVFGYYIEVTKSNLQLVPNDYIRKQTLANAERYITPELKEMEAKVVGSDERLKDLEYQLFLQIREEIKDHLERILNSAKILGQLDCITSLAEAAVDRNFIKPEIANDGNMKIIQGRHPVVEENLNGQWFIPNDVYLNSSDQRFLIITGPNMAGKSTYCRSVALISILMQIGSFVPAEKAILPILDRIFARIGASDDLSTGQSTFMVEMNEVANILNNATADSLIILDEVGRGTSTFDGLSIAWSLTEYIHSEIKAKTLFATHYHELTQLEEDLEGVKNYSVSVKENNDNIVFLHKIVPGGADRSYGIQVAKLAGLPSSLIIRAKDILAYLEKDAKKNQGETIPTISEPEVLEEPTFSDIDTKTRENSILQELAQIDLLNVTPLQAIQLLYELQNKLKQAR